MLCVAPYVQFPSSLHAFSSFSCVSAGSLWFRRTEKRWRRPQSYCGVVCFLSRSRRCKCCYTTFISTKLLFVYNCDVDVGIYWSLMKYHHFLVRNVSRPGGSKPKCISMWPSKDVLCAACWGQRDIGGSGFETASLCCETHVPCNVSKKTRSLIGRRPGREVNRALWLVESLLVLDSCASLRCLPHWAAVALFSVPSFCDSVSSTSLIFKWFEDFSVPATDSKYQWWCEDDLLTVPGPRLSPCECGEWWNQLVVIMTEPSDSTSDVQQQPRRDSTPHPSFYFSTCLWAGSSRPQTWITDYVSFLSGFWFIFILLMFQFVYVYSRQEEFHYFVCLSLLFDWYLRSAYALLKSSIVDKPNHILWSQFSSISALMHFDVWKYE